MAEFWMPDLLEENESDRRGFCACGILLNQLMDTREDVLIEAASNVPKSVHDVPQSCRRGVLIMPESLMLMVGLLP